MSQIRNMNNIQYFWWLTKQGWGHLWLYPRYRPCYINYVLFIANFAAAIAQRAYTDAGSLQVFALLAIPIFVLVVGTLGSWEQYGKKKLLPNPKLDGNWHQQVIYDKESEPGSDLITKKVKKLYQAIVRQFDPFVRSIPENLLNAALLVHITALIYLFYALPNFPYFVIAMWGFTTWHLLWALYISTMSISDNWV